MSRFTSHLDLRLLEYSDGSPLVRDGLCLWHGTSPLVWEHGRIGSGRFIIVPAFHPGGLTDRQLRWIAEGKAVAPGVTDLLSIPPEFRWLFSPSGPAAKAGVLHDYLYKTRGLYGHYSRAECDAIFHDAMIAVGVPPLQAWTLYQAVRAGGGRGWGG
ncbi:MAG: DUF1353 domain-containing protein [Pseudomonadota bacterium]